ncbi:MAG: amidohydrolase family protein, partial [Halodesulfurarchaeum sp.]
VGQRLAGVDLLGAGDRNAALDRLGAAEPGDRDWLLGFGFARDGAGPPTRADLDELDDDRPVAVFSRDMHAVALDSLALEAVEAAFPPGMSADGRAPDGLLTWPASSVVWALIAPRSVSGTREYLELALREAASTGLTTLHAHIHRSLTARALQEMARAGDLPVRVHLHYDLGTGPLDTGEGGSSLPAPLSGAGHLGIVAGTGNEYLRIEGVRFDAASPAGGADGWTIDQFRLEGLLEAASSLGLGARVGTPRPSAIERALEAWPDGRPAFDRVGAVPEDLAEDIGERGGSVVLAPDRDEAVVTSSGRNPSFPTQIAELQTAGVTVGLGSDSLQIDPTATVGDAIEHSDAIDVSAVLTVGGSWLGTGGSGTLLASDPADLIVLSESPGSAPPAETTVDLTMVGGRVRQEF